MARCPVCGGATSCPDGWYEIVKRPTWDDILDISRNQEVPEGYVVVGGNSRRKLAMPVHKDGLELLLTGSMQSERIRAHYGVSGMWVRQVTYAFYVKRRSW